MEISRRNVPGVTQTTEDWLWFQLSLIRENEAAGEAPHERYGLRDLGRVLVKFGEAHFDPKGNRPVLYFQVLLLSGQFERVSCVLFSMGEITDFDHYLFQAIAFLHQHPQFQADAVHFAIALAYYGLLKIPPKSKASEMELRKFPSLPINARLLIPTCLSQSSSSRKMEQDSILPNSTLLVSFIDTLAPSSKVMPRKRSTTSISSV